MSFAREKTDKELMCRVQNDDVEAFAELYDRHAARAFSVAVAVCRDRGRAEDAVQEGFHSIWRGRAGYGPRQGSFAAWSISVVRHRAIDSNRREAALQRPKLTRMNDEPVDTGARSVQDEVIARNESHALHSTLRRLPDAQAEVIALAFFGGLSHSEIAEKLALPSGTVKGRMRLGLQKMRERLEEHG